jgi:hypothetical protein
MLVDMVVDTTVVFAKSSDFPDFPEFPEAGAGLLGGGATAGRRGYVREGAGSSGLLDNQGA